MVGGRVLDPARLKREVEQGRSGLLGVLLYILDAMQTVRPVAVDNGDICDICDICDKRDTGVLACKVRKGPSWSSLRLATRRLRKVKERLQDCMAWCRACAVGVAGTCDGSAWLAGQRG